MERTPLLRTGRQTVAWYLRVGAPVLLVLVAAGVVAVGISFRRHETSALRHPDGPRPTVIGRDRPGSSPSPTRPISTTKPRRHTTAPSATLHHAPPKRSPEQVRTTTTTTSGAPARLSTTTTTLPVVVTTTTALAPATVSTTPVVPPTRPVTTPRPHPAPTASRSKPVSPTTTTRAPRPTTTTTPVSSTTTQPPTPSLYVVVQVGSASGGSVPVVATATLTEGTAPGVGQTVSFSVGGGCTPAATSGRTDGAGSTSVALSCPVGTAPITLAASSGGTEATTSFAPD